MKILFVTYDQPFTGDSGVSSYCRDLFAALLERGVSVGSLSVGGHDWRFRPYIRNSQEGDVALFSLVNSPLDPANSLLRPEQDSRHPTIESLVRSCLEQYRPDILHVQTLQGYPGSILAVAKDRGIPTIVMLHDFWAICPRVGLIRLRGDACDGPNGGLNCLQYCVQPHSWRQQLFRFGTRLPEGRLTAAFYGVRAIYVRHLRRETSMWTATIVTPVNPDKRLLSLHAARSAFLLRALDEATQLLAVSDFVKSTFTKHQISAARIRTFPPTLALESIPWKLHQARGPQIRFGFLGRAVPLKGVHVFAEAARNIPGNQARFLVFAPAPPETQRYLQQLAGNRLEFLGPYTRRELSSILNQLDVVVVPSVAQETVGLVTLEAHAAGLPVIGSRIGAIPEYIQDGENGLLFTPGDPQALQDKMLQIIGDPSLVVAMSARTRPPMAIAEHVDALLDLYTATTKGREHG